MHGIAIIALIIAVGLFAMSSDTSSTTHAPLLVWLLTLLAGFFYWLAEPNDD